MPRKPRDLEMIQMDPYLEPYEKFIRARLAKHAAVRRKLLPACANLQTDIFITAFTARRPAGFIANGRPTHVRFT